MLVFQYKKAAFRPLLPNFTGICKPNVIFKVSAFSLPKNAKTIATTSLQKIFYKNKLKDLTVWGSSIKNVRK